MSDYMTEFIFSGLLMNTPSADCACDKDVTYFQISGISAQLFKIKRGGR